MKNKVVLVTAIAATFAPMVAMSDASVYGQLRYSINSMDADTGSGSTLSGNDNVSLFGFKASSEGDGIKAFVHLQAGAPADVDSGTSTEQTVTITHPSDSSTETITATDTTDGGRAFKQRFYFGGLSGDFGTVAYGRMTNAYKFPGFKLDPFYNMSHVGAGGTLATGGATYGLSAATNGFTNNALQYTSNSFNGLKFNIGVYLDDSSEDDHGTNIGGMYTADNFNVGIQLASNGKTAATMPGVIADGDAVRLHGGYKGSGWSAGFSLENVDLTSTTDASYLYLVGKYDTSKNTQLVLSLGSVSEGSAEGSGFTGGVFHTVAPKTQLFASYSSASLDNKAAGAGEDPSVLSVGAIHKF